MRAAQAARGDSLRYAMSTTLGRLLLDGASEDRAVEGTTNHAYWTAYHEAREEAYRGA